MDIRQVKITVSHNYMEMAPLFAASGLENTDRVPEGFLEGWKALDDQDRILGACALVKRKECYILSDMAVEESLRGKDLGWRLLCKAMTRFQDMGASEVYLTAKVPEFYRKYGFHSVEPETVTHLFNCPTCNQFGKDCNPEFMKMELSGERLLFIDACISTHRSRTKQLCKEWLHRFLAEHPGIVTDTVVVEKGLCKPLDGTAARHRTDLVEAGAWEDPIFDLAKQFRAADYMLVGAPYWDFAFPSALKVYIENIVVDKLTFRESETGYVGLCPCRKLTYITTAGGPVTDETDLGYQYIKGIGGMLGIHDYAEFRAECLDIQGADIGAIVEAAKKEIRDAEKL